MNYARPPRRGAKDYILPILIVISLGVLIALTFQVGPQILASFGWIEISEENDSLTISGEAQLTPLKGEIEVYLPAAEAWKITSDATTLATGESVRTGADSRATLVFDDGTILNLGSASQVTLDEMKNTLTAKKASLTLDRGAAWVEQSQAIKSDFSLGNPIVRINESEGNYFMQTDAEKIDTKIAAVVGGLSATILDPQNERSPELKTVVVEEGSTLEISERRVNLLRIGGEIELVVPTDEDLKAAPLFLAMAKGITAPENPTDPETESETDEPAAETPTTPEAEEPVVETPTTTERLAAPTVTTSGGAIVATAEPVRVEGTAPTGAAKIQITPAGGSSYTLGAFKSGDKIWKYNASRDFGNLKAGSNSYTVVAIDAAGKSSPATTFTIDFTPPADEQKTEAETETTAPVSTEEKDDTDATPPETKPAEPEVSEPATPTDSDKTDGVPSVGSSTFDAPIVIEPLDGMEVSGTPVKISGTTSADTTEIRVWDYKLSKYVPGATTWEFYASPDFDNLDPGENKFRITAVNSAGEEATTELTIVYKPAE